MINIIKEKYFDCLCASFDVMKKWSFNSGIILYSKMFYLSKAFTISFKEIEATKFLNIRI